MHTDLAPRREAALRYLASAESCAKAAAAAQVAVPERFHTVRRRRANLRRRRALHEYAVSSAARERAAAEMRFAGAGAGSTWGLLSGAGTGGQTLTLETVIARLDPLGSDRRLAGTLMCLPQIRAQAELFGAEAALADLAAVVAAYPDPLLREFLPAELRPIPASVAELDRRSDLITFSVSESYRGIDGSAPRVRLHDVVSRWQGRGLGTAALVELCRYADYRGVPIVADFVPSFNLSPADQERLAAWYFRHGFEQNGKEPAEWSIGPMGRCPR